MGVQSDYLIAHVSEAETIRTTLCPLTDGRWKGIDAKGFDMIPMSELAAILADEAYRNELVDEWASLYDGEEEGETCLFKVPEQLTNDLAVLEDERLEQVAQDWVAHEKFPGKWQIELQHRGRKEGFLTRLLGRSRGTAPEVQAPDFSPLLPCAREMLGQFRSLAREAKQQDKHLLLWMST